jgi:hypothetical protein
MVMGPRDAFEKLKIQQNAPQSLRPALILNLGDAEDLRQVNGRLKWAPGLIPGAPNEGIVAGQFLQAAPRLADFDDSAWETPKNIMFVAGGGFTFAWYRFTIVLPERVRGLEVAGAQIWFETRADDYGEVWVDCPPFDDNFRAAQAIAANKLSPVQGYNAANRILITRSAEVGRRHVIACLAINGPLAQPLGGVFLRYARLEICQGLGKVPI